MEAKLTYLKLTYIVTLDDIEFTVTKHSDNEKKYIVELFCSKNKAKYNLLSNCQKKNIRQEIEEYVLNLEF